MRTDEDRYDTRAAWLKGVRDVVARAEDASHGTVNRSLANVRPMFAALIFDGETRSVEVNFAWSIETKVGPVPSSARGSYSAYSAPWRVRASRRAARLKT